MVWANQLLGIYQKTPWHENVYHMYATFSKNFQAVPKHKHKHRKHHTPQFLQQAPSKQASEAKGGSPSYQTMLHTWVDDLFLSGLVS